MRSILYVRQSAVLSNRIPSLGDFREVKHIRGLVSLGHRVTMVFSSFDHYSKTQRVENCFIESTESVCFYTPGYSRNISLMRVIDAWVFALKVAWLILTSRRKYDTLFVAYPTPEALFVCSLFKSNKQKLIVDVRDAWPSVRPHNNIAGWLFGVYAKYFLKFGCKRATDIVCMSGGMQGFVKKFLPGTKTTIMLNPITLGNDHEEQDNYNNKGVLQFLFVGTLNGQFEFDTIAKLSELCSDNNIRHKILIVGGGENYNSFKNQYESENIKFTGPKDKIEVDKLISEVDICFAYYVGSAFKGHVTNKLLEYAGKNKIIFHNLGDSFLVQDAKISIGYHTPTPSTAFELILRYRRKELKVNIDSTLFTTESDCADKIIRL